MSHCCSRVDCTRSVLQVLPIAGERVPCPGPTPRTVCILGCKAAFWIVNPHLGPGRTSIAIVFCVHPSFHAPSTWQGSRDPPLPSGQARSVPGHSSALVSRGESDHVDRTVRGDLSLPSHRLERFVERTSFARVGTLSTKRGSISHANMLPLAHVHPFRRLRLVFVGNGDLSFRFDAITPSCSHHRANRHVSHFHLVLRSS